MRTPPVLLLLAAVGLSACAGVAGPSGGGSTRPPATGDGGPAPNRYQATGTVLQNGDEPAGLCLGGVATSLPPQCGGIPMPNWDWDAVEGEQRMSGVIWGDYHVIGTYDGETFTVEEAGPPQQPELSESPIETPCEEPAGGWRAEDPSRAGLDDLDRIVPGLREEPDFAGLWLDYVNEPTSEMDVAAGEIILTVAFTADLERHRAEIADSWGGPLCVVQHEHTMDELLAIQSEIGDGSGIGLQLLSSSASEVHNRVEATVVLAAPEDQAALDARYGPGTVVLDSALKPA